MDWADSRSTCSDDPISSENNDRRTHAMHVAPRPVNGERPLRAIQDGTPSGGSGGEGVASQPVPLGHDAQHM